MLKRLTVKSLTAATMIASATFANADDHVSVEGADQDMSNGIVSASKVMADENGWLVVHRTDGTKPGVVVAHAPLRKGENTDVAAILTEPAAKGDKFMLMLHSEQGGTKTGIFEYSLGAKEDGPIKVDGKLVMKIIEAQ
jgi:hypothetical protein